MATRNPTSLDLTRDLSSLRSRQYVKGALPSLIADDQVYILDAPQLILSHGFNVIRNQSAAYTTVRTLKVHMKRMSDVLPAASTISCKMAVYAWTNNASITTYKVQVTDGSGSMVATVSASTTTKQWTLSTASTFDTTAACQLNINVESTVGDAAGRYVYIAGLIIYSEET